METYVCSGAFALPRAEETLQACRAAGVRRLELSSGLRCDEAGLMRLEAAKAEGFRFLVHNYFPVPDEPFVLNLADADPRNLDRSLTHCRRAIDICRRLDAPVFTVHSGFALPVRPEDLGRPDGWLDRLRESGADTGRARGIFRESVQDLADYAAGRGVALAIENNNVPPDLTRDRRDHGLLMSEGPEIADFFATLGRPRVGLLLDVGHAKVSATALGFRLEAFMDAVGPVVRGFHLSDNDGLADTNGPVRPDSWFLPWLHHFADAFFVIEAYRLTDEAIGRQLALIDGALRRNDAMAEGEANAG